MSYDRWLATVDRLLVSALGRGTESMEEAYWLDLYESRYTPMDAFHAYREEIE